MRLISLLLLCSALVASAAPWGPNANMVAVDPSGFVVIPGTSSNAQSAIDALDDALTNRLTQSQISALFLAGTNVVGASYSNGQWTINSQTAGLLAGTNIIGATYSGGQWTINSQTAGLLAGTNIIGGTLTNGQWDLSAYVGMSSNDYFIAVGDSLQVVAASAHTLMTFSDQYDAGAMFITNTFRPNRDGVYFVHAYADVRTANAANDRSLLHVYKNGAQYRTLFRDREDVEMTLAGSMIEVATTNDVYQVWQNKDGTGALTNLANGRFFSAVRLGGT